MVYQRLLDTLSFCRLTCFSKVYLLIKQGLKHYFCLGTKHRENCCKNWESRKLDTAFESVSKAECESDETMTALRQSIKIPVANLTKVPKISLQLHAALV